MEAARRNSYPQIVGVLKAAGTEIQNNFFKYWSLIIKDNYESSNLLLFCEGGEE